jgi:hypothetical protein
MMYIQGGLNGQIDPRSSAAVFEFFSVSQCLRGGFGLRRMGKLKILIANLEIGRPTANEALLRLDFELARARRAGALAVKIIHGYGSSGVGGVLRESVQQALRAMADQNRIRAFVAGEDWRISNETAWAMRNSVPELKQDPDLGRGNKGISIVLL